MRKIKTKQSAQRVFVTRNRVEPFIALGASKASSTQYWNWGEDNLFPYALALMSRRSTTHRRIINDKADYISGKGFSYDENVSQLGEFINSVNGSGETMRQLINKLAFDKALFGNAFMEVVTDSRKSYLSIFHQDASRCRISRDEESVIMHHNWAEYRSEDAKKISLYPNFDEASDGTLRTMIHYKDYEPTFEHYGVPPYIAGLNVSAIAYKTDAWNISRLDNSFQLSGVMMLDGSVDNEQQAAEIVQAAESKFAGKPGQVMFMVKESDEHENSRFIPINSSNEGDWKHLHDQATSDIVVAHSWFRSLSGLDYSSGFNAERILHEYEVALNTVILGEQEEIIEPLRTIINQILGVDASSLNIVNRPPTRSKPLYMKIWEARKADGLDYDQQDPNQQLYTAQITKYAMRNID